jgi:hypothetical protein
MAIKSIYQPMGSRNLRFTLGKPFEIDGTKYMVGSITNTAWTIDVFDDSSTPIKIATIFKSGMGATYLTDKELHFPMGAKSIKYKVGNTFTSYFDGTKYTIGSIVVGVDDEVDVFDDSSTPIKLVTFVPSGMTLLNHV